MVENLADGKVDKMADLMDGYLVGMWVKI